MKSLHRCIALGVRTRLEQGSWVQSVIWALGGIGVFFFFFFVSV